MWSSLLLLLLLLLLLCVWQQVKYHSRNYAADTVNAVSELDSVLAQLAVSKGDGRKMGRGGGGGEGGGGGGGGGSLRVGRE